MVWSESGGVVDASNQKTASGAVLVWGGAGDFGVSGDGGGSVGESVGEDCDGLKGAVVGKKIRGNF